MDFAPASAHIRGAQGAHQIAGFRLQLFLRGDERLNLGFEVAVGLAAGNFHLLNLRVDFAQRFAHGSDQIDDRFLAGIERRIVAFQCVGGERLERVLQVRGGAVPGFGQQFDLLVAGLSFRFQSGFQAGAALHQVALLLQEPRQIGLYGG